MIKEMNNKTRNQLIKEEKYNLIEKAVKDGFYLYEIAEMFKMTEGRISQILKENLRISRKQKEIIN